MGRPSNTLPERLPAVWSELLGLMPCFYDLKAVCARDIAKLSASQFKKARSLTGTARMWPFYAIKTGVHKSLNWALIRDMRGRAILTASPEMKAILYKAEKRAHLMRLWSLSQETRISVVENSFFPDFPADDKDKIDFLETDGTNPHTQIANLIEHHKKRKQEEDEEALLVQENVPLTITGRERREIGLKALDGNEVEQVILCMVDVQAVQVASLLRISHHTLRDLRRKIGLSDWPFDSIRRGTYSMTAVEVSNKRLEMIARLPLDSVAREVLVQVCKLASTPSTNEVWQAIPVTVTNERPASDEEAHQKEETWFEPVTAPAPPCLVRTEQEEDAILTEELRDWFGGLLDQDETGEQISPEDAKWLEEECSYYEQKSFWDETDPETGFTPEQQRYWDSLAEITLEAMC